jgi:uncharacterized protein (TIGR00730 family)
MNEIKSIGVYCGSSLGNDERFADGASILGKYCANKNIKIIYGGAKVGLMGVLANECLTNGGEVVGVLPHFLRNKEVSHDGLTELHIVENMHIRKQMMYDLSDAFIALPGGYGTMDEIFEMLTWAQLGIHKKPIGLLNTADYYTHLLHFIDHAIDSKLLRQENKSLLNVHNEVEPLIDLLKNYKSEVAPKWIK